MRTCEDYEQACDVLQKFVAASRSPQMLRRKERFGQTRMLRERNDFATRVSRDCEDAAMQQHATKLLGQTDCAIARRKNKRRKSSEKIDVKHIAHCRSEKKSIYETIMNTTGLSGQVRALKASLVNF